MAGMQSWMCSSCLERREDIVYHKELPDCTDLQHEIGDWPVEIRGERKLRGTVLVSVTDCLTEKIIDGAFCR